ncbi:MAG: hypothetical protein ACR2HK_06765 [Gemmatimonadales bacterium]
MSRRIVRRALAVALLAAGCGQEDRAQPAAAARSGLAADQQDAELLGREIFELVDRAIDFRGSHRGRPAGSLSQMGIDSLTPTTARWLVNLAREPVVTAKYRRAEDRSIISCRGDSQILEEAAINGGRFTLMCTTRSGTQRPIRIADPAQGH